MPTQHRNSLRWLIALIVGAALIACRTTPTPTTPPSTSAPEPTPTVEMVPLPTSFFPQEPAETIFPGPLQYEGDVLDVLFNPDDQSADEFPVMVQIDGGEEFEATGIAQYPGYLLVGVYDTRDRPGTHTIRITSPTDPSVDIEYTFEVLPADQRPAQEAEAQWRTRTIECCILHFLSNTAAERDIELIADAAQLAVDEVIEASGAQLGERIDITLLDRMFYNGGMGGSGQIGVTYTDRYYGPRQGRVGQETIFRHEATHALWVHTESDESQFPYGEGLAVYYAGGHYKPEPLPERGAAMLALGWYTPLADHAWSNHEIAYLREALVVYYVIETYGKDAFLRFVNYRIEGEQFPETGVWLEGAVQELGVGSLAEFESDLKAWLLAHDPGDQVDDLRLTVELQGLRRVYQDTHAPAPQFFLIDLSTMTTNKALMPQLMREPHAPENIALELVIMHAQLAIIGGDYELASSLVDVLRAALENGNPDAGPLPDYRAIAGVAAEAGYEVVDIQIDGDTADVKAIRVQPEIETLTFTLIDGVWTLDE